MLLFRNADAFRERVYDRLVMRFRISSNATPSFHTNKYPLLRARHENTQTTPSPKRSLPQDATKSRLDFFKFYSVTFYSRRCVLARPRTRSSRKMVVINRSDRKLPNPPASPLPFKCCKRLAFLEACHTSWQPQPCLRDKSLAS